jgi:hypothetical protein
MVMEPTNAGRFRTSVPWIHSPPIDLDTGDRGRDPAKFCWHALDIDRAHDLYHAGRLVRCPLSTNRSLHFLADAYRARS